MTAPEKLTGEDGLPAHNVWLAMADTVGIPFTVMVPVAFTVPQPPVRGME